MTKRVQVIGLPGAGKSTAIETYMLGTTQDVRILDIRNFAGMYRDRIFRKEILRAKKDLIAESACGVHHAGFVILLQPPISQVYAQLLDRDKVLDEDYLSLLSTQMIAADYTIGIPEDLPELLRILLEE